MYCLCTGVPNTLLTLFSYEMKWKYGTLIINGNSFSMYVLVIRIVKRWYSLASVVVCWLMRSPTHDDVIKWKHFPRYWPFVGGIHRSPVNSPHKGQRRGALTFSLICSWINGWVNTRDAGDLRRHRVHYNVIVMINYDIEHSAQVTSLLGLIFWYPVT